MMSPFLFMLIFVHNPKSETITCTDSCRCNSGTSTGVTCTIDCSTESSACKGKELECRSGDPCIIDCRAYGGCEDALIIGELASHVSVYCQGDQACKGSSEIDCGTGDCFVNCIGGIDVCTDLSIFNLPGARSFQCVGSCGDLKVAPLEYSPSPTRSPTQHPVPSPTSNPTTSTPTAVPTSNPIPSPTSAPTINPTPAPTNNPTKKPSSSPTQPTTAPTSAPTATTTEPTPFPTTNPSCDPTTDPTSDPTKDPSADPTSDPTVDPTLNPTTNPTPTPTNPILVVHNTPTTSPIISTIATMLNDNEQTEENGTRDTDGNRMGNKMVVILTASMGGLCITVSASLIFFICIFKKKQGNKHESDAVAIIVKSDTSDYGHYGKQEAVMSVSNKSNINYMGDPVLIRVASASTKGEVVELTQVITPYGNDDGAGANIAVAEFEVVGDDETRGACDDINEVMVTLEGPENGDASERPKNEYIQNVDVDNIQNVDINNYLIEDDDDDDMSMVDEMNDVHVTTGGSLDQMDGEGITDDIEDDLLLKGLETMQ